MFAYEPKMKLTDEQKAVFEGAQGDVIAKAFETIVRFGDYMGATHFVPITHRCGHLVNSSGASALKQEYKILESLLNAGAKINGGFTANPRAIDFENINTNFIEQFILKHIIYNNQGKYEEALRNLGILNFNTFTCVPYLEEIGNTPKPGNVLSWSDASSVCYINSVLGARSNINPPVVELLCSLFGVVPYYGFVVDACRRAKWKINLNVNNYPLPNLLGAVIAKKVGSDVPYIIGLDRWIGHELNDTAKAYMKDLGSAANTYGSVGLIHVDYVTPEAKKYANNLFHKDIKEITITDSDLDKEAKENTATWDANKSKINLALIGCPHLNLEQLNNWSTSILMGLKKFNKPTIPVETVLFTSPQVLMQFMKEKMYQQIKNAGVKVSAICPLMYTANPFSKFKKIITNSMMCKKHSNAKYVKDNVLLNLIVSGGQNK